jgi:hypothetical protein
MDGRAVAAAGAPTPPHCSRLQMCGRSPRAPCLFGSSFFLFVSVRSSSNGVRIFLVAVCGSGGESSCYSYSESSNTGSELGLDHVFEMQQLIRTKATSSTDGYSTSDTVQVCTTLRSHSDSCASSGARAGDLRAVAVGRENRCTSVSRIFALFCCRETWPPRPRAPTSHTSTGRYLFSPCLSVGCLILEAAARFLLTLASAGFAKKKKTLASASRTAKQRLGAVRENSGANGAREAETQRPRLVHPLDAVARFFFVATYCISFPRW